MGIRKGQVEVEAEAEVEAQTHYCFHLTYNILHFGQPLKISARKTYESQNRLNRVVTLKLKLKKWLRK